MKVYDVLVIGGGAAGLTAAITAKGFGKTVLLIEKDKTGGECTWSGCIPSKALINYANEIYSIKKHIPSFMPEPSAPFERVNQVIESVYAEETPEKLRALGIDVLEGHAKFISPQVVKVAKESIKGKKIIVATGSKPLIPAIPGLEHIDYLTNESVFKLKRLPKSLLIVGTGAISIELAQAMNRLGVLVTVVGRSQGILKKEEMALSSRLMSYLEKEGVVFKTGLDFKEFSRTQQGVSLTYAQTGIEGCIEAEKLLIATGRQASIEGLDLDHAGVAYNKAGIEVDKTLRTSHKNIYGIGDVVGPYRFSHMANVQGIRAVQNAILPFNRPLSYKDVAWCTFTQPELARAGLTEEEANKKYGQIRVYNFDYGQLDRVKTKPGTGGMVKIILDRKGKVLGASILGERAGELISEIQVLKTLGLPYRKLLNVIHPYPTYSEVLSKISKQVAVDDLMNHPVVKFFRKGQ